MIEFDTLQISSVVYIAQIPCTAHELHVFTYAQFHFECQTEIDELNKYTRIVFFKSHIYSQS